MLRLISNYPRLVEMYKLVEVFNLPRQQRNTIFRIVAVLEANGKTFEEFYYYLKEVHRLEVEQIQRHEKIRGLLSKACPVCNSIMRLLAVNVTPDTQTGDPADKSVWFCGKEGCMETIFNTKAIETIIQERGGT